jgi:hypothetical protein
MRACAGKVSGSASRSKETDCENEVCLPEQFVGLSKEVPRFRRHKSMPSRRISRINGVRSM